MGVAGLIIGTLGTAYLQGRAAREQAEAQAAQAEANARLQAREAENAARNADQANKKAEEMARVNAQNVENRRRQMLQREGEQRAKIAASNVTATGSALNALADTRWDIDQDTAMQLYNGQQDVYQMFGQATDYANQSNKYKYNAAVEQNNAANYRAAGKRAQMNAWLGGAFSLASSLSGIGGGGSNSGTTSWSGSGTDGGTWTVGGKTGTENWGSASNLRLRR